MLIEIVISQSLRVHDPTCKRLFSRFKQLVTPLMFHAVRAGGTEYVVRKDGITRRRMHTKPGWGSLAARGVLWGAREAPPSSRTHAIGRPLPRTHTASHPPNRSLAFFYTDGHARFTRARCWSKGSRPVHPARYIPSFPMARVWFSAESLLLLSTTKPAPKACRPTRDS